MKSNSLSTAPPSGTDGLTHGHQLKHECLVILRPAGALELHDAGVMIAVKHLGLQLKGLVPRVIGMLDGHSPEAR